MPNWCNNNITISGDGGMINTLTAVLKNLKSNNEERGNDVFKSLIGLPPHMTDGDYNAKWYDTNIEWFGTKWDISYEEHAFTFIKDDYKTKINFNLSYEIKIFKLIKIKIVIPLHLDFNISTGEISFFCETAWSPPIPFMENLCKMYKVNGNLFYSEGGIGFAGETTFTWVDDELEVYDDECGYLEGIYKYSKEEFWSEVECRTDCIIDEDQSLEDFLGEFQFVSDEDKEELTRLYNETIKRNEEESEGEQDDLP
jgi:hypothetical protein